MYYSPQRANPWNQRDEIHRIALDSNSSLSTIDAGARLGFEGVVHGMNQIGEEVWISVVETSGWGGGNDPVISLGESRGRRERMRRRRGIRRRMGPEMSRFQFLSSLRASFA